MRKTALILTLAGAAGVSSVAQAGPKNILVYEEFTLGVSAYIEAMNRQVIDKGWTYTLLNDGFAFQAALAGPDLYDHVIVAHQNTFGAGTWDQGVGTGGLADWALSHPDGQVLISDWRVNNPQPYLAALGFSYTGATNPTNLTGVAGTALDGISSPLFSPGWGIYGYGTAGGVSIATNGPGGYSVANQNGKWYFNGFLSDTFADGAQGIQAVLNEIKKVPAPGALALLGVAGLVGRRRRR